MRIFLLFFLFCALKASAIHQVCTFEPTSPLNGGGNSSAVGYYYHEDNLNSSSALSDSSGNQIEVDSYFPFGRTQTASPQAAFQVSRRFTGQVFDAESGLYYYNARYFDPELGRFIQADTEIPDFGNPQSYNRYSYVMNNPLRYNDPSGHSWYDYIPGIGPGIEEIKGNVALENMAQRAGYISYAQARQSFGGQATVANVGMVAGVGHVTAGAADAYITGAQEIATAGMATGVIAVRSAGRALASGAEETALTQGGTQAFKSFDALKRALGPAGEGRVWHHIVEQRAANVEKFGAGAIHNTENVVNVTKGVN